MYIQGTVNICLCDYQYDFYIEGCLDRYIKWNGETNLDSDGSEHEII